MLDIMKILLVDPSPSIRRVEIHILSLMGFNEIEQSNNSFDALSRLENDNIDLVICDWDLPGEGGLALLNDIRTHDAIAKTPVLMMVNEMNDKTILQTAKAGVSSLIVKPFTVKSLKEEINNICPYISK